MTVLGVILVLSAIAVLSLILLAGPREKTTGPVGDHIDIDMWFEEKRRV
jgi:hypothetical protein